MKILMVCLGNICRSPLAEGILKSKLQQNDLHWEVDSAGTGAWHIGQLPDQRSIRVAKMNGINIEDQTARQLKGSDLDDFDLLLAMDKSNFNNILKLATKNEHRDKVRTILEFSNQPKSDVPDPYYDDNGFENVYKLLDGACENMIKELG